MTILITSPDYDNVTSYLLAYTKQVLAFAEKNGKKVHYLARPRLTRKIFTQMIEQQNPQLLLLNGHGDSTTIFGDKIDGEPEALVEEGTNHKLLEGKLTYARACAAAASLGKTAVKNSGCFIGYKESFQWWTDANWYGNPTKDKTAKLFLDPTNLLCEALIKGKTAEHAANIFTEECKKNITQLLRKSTERGTLASVMLLWSNINSQVVLGDEEMKCVT